ncbi:MAG: hypothetical protein EBZ03_00940 [Betaproteobacteria bacterium]|nr:hypothetical protein [Betaproteobacteria bacterium]NBQ08585.1 hypothetical protein [Betaproteobacteria bacterium]NCV89395.1 hypothetical protein [Betaproteobacteria bacterium]NCW31755.1 hypothetical protein [Betaproteobacteria bacterium]NCX88201.1 hypothetical protein [Betaproteobacteria bacterium]
MFGLSGLLPTPSTLLRFTRALDRCASLKRFTPVLQFKALALCRVLSEMFEQSLSEMSKQSLCEMSKQSLGEMPEQPKCLKALRSPV